MKLGSPVEFPTTTRSRTRRRLLIAGSILVVIATVYLGFSYFVISFSLTPRPICPAGTPLDIQPAPEPVRFQSDVDQIPLVGWLMSSSGDRAIVLVHGIHSDGWSGGRAVGGPVDADPTGLEPPPEKQVHRPPHVSPF